MLDLGASFVASVARDPHATAIVDGGVRLTYAEWYRRISSVAASLRPLGLKAGDHIVTVAAELRGGCDPALGLPVGGHCDHADQLARQGRRTRFLHRKFRSRAPCSTRKFRREAVAGSKRASGLPRIAVGCEDAGAVDLTRMASEPAPDASPRAGAEDGRSCSIRRARRRGRKACRAGTAPSAPPASPMWRRIFTGAASARSASCRSITPWAFVR